MIDIIPRLQDIIDWCNNCRIHPNDKKPNYDFKMEILIERDNTVKIHKKSPFAYFIYIRCGRCMGEGKFKIGDYNEKRK